MQMNRSVVRNAIKSILNFTSSVSNSLFKNMKMSAFSAIHLVIFNIFNLQVKNEMLDYVALSLS